MPDSLLIIFAVFVMALLYSSVGHGGGSGYLAAMALLGVAAAVMRPAALVLNLVVAGVATVQFARAGHFRWRVFWPFALLSVPLAYAGGKIGLPATIYKQLVGAALLFAAARLFLAPRSGAEADATPPLVPVALGVGGALGFLAGLTSVGGGIFLSPLLLLFNWAGVRETAAVSAAFILVNSAAGLAGQWAAAKNLPSAVAGWALAAGAGGLLGSELGRRRLDTLTLRRLLAAVLLIAGVKLLVS
jgi:uncharacterized membrane protein YfcA